MKTLNLFILSIAIIYILTPTTNLEISSSIFGNASTSSINIGIEVKNVSGKSIKVNKNRIVDYKREKIGSIGNFIIEMQIRENGEYQLLEPSADINPGFNNDEFINIDPGKILYDTIKIRGFLFARNGNVGFRPGSYRLRLTFNSDFWGGGTSAKTDWINYEIRSE